MSETRDDIRLACGWYDAEIERLRDEIAELEAKNEQLGETLGEAVKRLGCLWDRLRRFDAYEVE